MFRSRSRNSYRVDPGFLFSPKSLGSNLVAWYRADLGVTLNSTTVSAWADQSGNGRHLSQATALNQPLFVSSGVNSRPVLRFNNTEAMTSALGPLAAPLSVYVTAKFKDATNPTDFDYIYCLGNRFSGEGGLIALARWKQDGGANENKLYSVEQETSIIVTTDGAVTDTNWRIFNHYHKTTAAKNNLEIAASPVTITDYSVTISTGGVFTIGAYNATVVPEYANFFAGDIHEIVITNSILSTAKNLQLSRYMANRVSASVA